jgi:hypothetical protein
MIVHLRRANRLALSALLGAMLLATMATAEAQAQQYFKVVARHSGMCLDVAHASAAHAADVVQGSCPGPGGYNQQWTLVGTGSGYYQYRPRHVGGMCLDVAHLSIAHGANVIQGTCWSPGPNQQWIWVATSGGYGTLRPRHSSNKCLDVANFNYAHGADVIQADCWNGRNQQWRLIPTS